MEWVPGVNPELPPPGTFAPGQPQESNIMQGMQEAIARADEARRVQQEIEELKRKTDRMKAQSAFFKAQQDMAQWRDQGVTAQDRTAAQARQIRKGEMQRLKTKAVSPTPQEALSWTRGSPEHQDFITWGGQAPDLQKLRLQAAQAQVAESTGYLPEVAPGVVELGPSLSKRPLSTRKYAYGHALQMRRDLQADRAARRMQEAEAAWQRANWRPPGRAEVEMMKADTAARTRFGVAEMEGQSRMDVARMSANARKEVAKITASAKDYPPQYKADLQDAVTAIEEGRGSFEVYRRMAQEYPQYSAELKRILLAEQPASFLEAWAQKQLTNPQ